LGTHQQGEILLSFLSIPERDKTTRKREVNNKFLKK
jgi:hypothetical protein